MPKCTIKIFIILLISVFSLNLFQAEVHSHFSEYECFHNTNDVKQDHLKHKCLPITTSCILFDVFQQLASQTLSKTIVVIDSTKFYYETIPSFLFKISTILFIIRARAPPLNT